MTGTPDPPFPMRLQKFLARAGVASRRGSEDLITAGRVCVNGACVTELGSKVDPKSDEVTVDGRVVSLADEHTYLMLNKPADYLTTMADPRGRACVAELVPISEHPGLFPVGRLDKDTTGLLLFTTDGEAAQALLHPRHHARKTYVALVEGQVRERELDRLRLGITLDDGPCQPARAEALKMSDPLARAVVDHPMQGCSVVSLTIGEGRKHQVKRMLGAIGHPVVRLHRHSFGPLELSGVKPGAWRSLSKDEVAAIRDHLMQEGG